MTAGITPLQQVELELKLVQEQKKAILTRHLITVSDLRTFKNSSIETLLRSSTLCLKDSEGKKLLESYRIRVAYLDAKEQYLNRQKARLESEFSIQVLKK